MQHADEQQKALATRRRRSSCNQPDEKDLLRSGNRLPGCGTIGFQGPRPSALESPQPLVRYFDDRGGFFRVGRVTDSHAATRGRHKGRIIITILTELNQRVTRNGDEVELVK
jgi:hypothetical protein